MTIAFAGNEWLYYDEANIKLSSVAVETKKKKKERKIIDSGKKNKIKNELENQRYQLTKTTTKNVLPSE